MKKFLLFLFSLVFIFSCEVDNPGIPSWSADYGFILLKDSINVPQELSQFSDNLTQKDGKLYVETSLDNNLKLGLEGESSSATLQLDRVSEIRFSNIANRNFNFKLKELDEQFYSLDQYSQPAPYDVSNFDSLFADKSTNETGENYQEFESVKVTSSKLSVEVTNNTGLNLASNSEPFVVNLKQANGTMLAIPQDFFKFFSLADGEKWKVSYSYGSVFNPKTFYNELLVEISGKNQTTGRPTLSAVNNLNIEVSFDSIGSLYQIAGSEYVAISEKGEITKSGSTKVKVLVDKNNNNVNDIDIYKGTFSINAINKLDLNVLLNSQSACELYIWFPEINTGYSINDSLVKYFYIPKPESGQTSRSQAEQITLAGYSIGEDYKDDSSKVYNEISIGIRAVFSDPNRTTTIKLGDYVKVDFNIQGSEFEQLQAVVKEDIVLDSQNKKLDVDLTFIEVQDNQGRPLDSVNLLGNSKILTSYTTIISSLIDANKFDADNNLINLTSSFGAVSPNNVSIKRSFADTQDVDITSTMLFTRVIQIGDDDDLIRLLELLPNEITFTQKALLKKSGIPLRILGSRDFAFKASVTSDIIFDTKEDTISFIVRELKKDSKTYERVVSSINDSPLSESQVDNFIEGNLILGYSNRTTANANAKIIVSSDSSVVYKPDLQTDGSIKNVGKSGYPSYIARVFRVQGLVAGAENKKISIPLTQSDLEPFVFEPVYVGIVLPLQGRNIDFAGDIELVGKIEFKLKIDDDIY